MSSVPIAVGLVVVALLVPRRLVWLGPRPPGARGKPQIDGAELPDALDLLALAASSGLGVAGSLALVCRYGPPAVAARVVPISMAIESGRPVASAMEASDVDPGEPLGIVLAALRQAHVDGAVVEARLVSLGSDLRAVARSRQQVAARKLSVRLLLPLVACMLPAFALLTVVPVLVDALEL